MSYIVDLEANGFYAEATVIHCLCIYDMKTGKIESYYQDTLEQGLQKLQQLPEIVGHNLLGYDIPLIEKLYPWFSRPSKIVDTLVLSRLFFPDRIMGHALASYGEEFGVAKPVHEDWETFSMDMLTRCQMDVKINARVYDYLMQERKKWDWEMAIRLEQRMAEIMFLQECTGVEFDTDLAERLVIKIDNHMDDLMAEIRPQLHSFLEVTGACVKNPFKKDGAYMKRVAEYWGEDIYQVKGPYTPIKFVEPDLNKREQIIKQLLAMGWEPVNFTPTGKPKLDEASIRGDHNDLVKKLMLWYQLRQRRSQVCNPTDENKGLKNNVREDGRIPAKTIPQATNTGRMRHILVANIPKADPSIPYGTEVRQLFTHKNGCKLIGCDAKGLELRMLAHYMDDEDFTQEVIAGDIHEHNRVMAGLQTRQQAKSFIYAFLYGAGVNKLSKVLGMSEREASAVKRQFMDNIPKLKQLIKDVQDAAERGYVKGLDGRKVPIRSQHAALNCLLQSAGSIVMKTATAILNKELTKHNLSAKMVINYHDEYIIECPENELDKVKGLAAEAIVKAGNFFKLKVPLEGDVMVGNNWAEVH